MKQPFPVKLRRYEIVAGLLWLAVYLFLLGPALSALLEGLGMPDDSPALNKVYFLTGFLGTAAIFRRFLAASLGEAVKQPLRVLRGVLFGYCIYAVCQVAAGMLLELFAPELENPNDESIQALAMGNYPMMLAATVLLTPLTEETLLRGLVFGGLREKSRGLAYVATALVFAGMHVIPYLSEMDRMTAALNCGLYILPGVALCACYELAGTVWAPILLHALINGIGMWAMRIGA